MQRLPVEKENAIHAWLSAVLPGDTVIWDKGDGRRPAAPFSAMSVISGPTNVGKAEEIYQGPGTYTYIIRKVFTLSIQTFGADALVRSNDIIDSLELPTRLAILQDAGFGVWGYTAPLDLSGFLDTRYEGRAVVDLTLAYAVEVQDTPGEINIVNATETLDGHNRPITIDIAQ